MKGLLLILALCSQLQAQRILAPILAGAPAAAGGITVTSVAQAAFTSNGVTTQILFNGTMGAAGDLVTVTLAWQTPNSRTVTSLDVGGVTATCGTKRTVTTVEAAQVCYVLSGPGGAINITLTMSGSTDGFQSFIHAWHKSSGTWSFDTDNAGGGAGTTAVNTGNITTTTTGGEVVIMYTQLANTGATLGSPTINGVTPTESSDSPDATYDHEYYRLMTTTFTGGNGAGTYSPATDHIEGIAAFKAQ